MTSYTIEKSHAAELDQLLLDSGLTCDRSTSESEEVSSESEDTEKTGQIPEVETDVSETVTEEEHVYEAEVIEEESPKVYPSPSLRRLLPDRIRSIEKQNRVHVLPDEFRLDFDPMKIPKISATAPQSYISQLAELIGCDSYTSSLAEYWFLDTLANLLRRAQKDRLDKPAQALLIRWFCEWMREMQHFDAANRQRMLKRFKENMVAAARFVAKDGRIPTPSEIGISHLTEKEIRISRQPASQVDSKPLVSFQGAGFNCSLLDLTKIIHYIYDLFSTDFQYELIRSMFTFTPEYQLIDAPHQIRQPKRMYAPLKTKIKDRTVKKDSKASKGNRREVDTEEYLHLLKVQNEIEREKEEEAERDREDWNRRSHIVPLAFAVSEDFFEKYWPPPPVEVPMEPEPEDKGKRRNKKK